MKNIESVQYNFISHNVSHIKKSNSYLGGIQNNKIMTPNKSMDKYQINVLKSFNKVNGRDLKKYFYGEGLHLFNFNEKQDFLNENKGIFTFQIRRNDNANDNDYENKISNINKQLVKQNMTMNKVSIMNKASQYIPFIIFKCYY